MATVISRGAAPVKHRAARLMHVRGIARLLLTGESRLRYYCLVIFASWTRASLCCRAASLLPRVCAITDS